MSYNDITTTSTTTTTTTTLEPCGCGSIYIPKGDIDFNTRIKEDYVLHLSAGSDNLARVNGFMQGADFEFLHTQDIFLEAGQVFKSPVNFDVAGGPAYEILAWKGDLDGEVSFFTFNIENRIKVIIRNIFDNEVIAVGYFGKVGETISLDRLLLSSCNNYRSAIESTKGRFLLEIYSICEISKEACCDGLPSFDLDVIIDEFCFEPSCTTTTTSSTTTTIPPTTTTTTSTTSTTTSTTTTTTTTTTSTTTTEEPTTTTTTTTTEEPTTTQEPTTTTTTQSPTTTTTTSTTSTTTTTTVEPTTSTTTTTTTEPTTSTTLGPTVTLQPTDPPSTTTTSTTITTTNTTTTSGPTPEPPTPPSGGSCPEGYYETAGGCCPNDFYWCTATNLCVPNGQLCTTPDPFGSSMPTSNEKVFGSSQPNNTHEVDIGHGAGTELKKILGFIGITSTPTCSCNAKAKIMNEKGVEWCKNNIDVIVSWLKEEASKRNLPFYSFIAKKIVKIAIGRAER